MASEDKDKKTQKIKALGIVYRVLLILGIVLFIATAFLAIFTVRITVWYLSRQPFSPGDHSGQAGIQFVPPFLIFA